MTAWLPAAIISLLSFGLWGFFTKIALTYVDAKSALVYNTFGVLIIGFIILYTQELKPIIAWKGVSFGLLTGIAYGIGCLFYLFAADKGKLITVVTLTALYPLVTIILSWMLLHETISTRQMLGIMFSIIAIWLMSA